MKVYILEDESLILKHLMQVLEEVPFVQVIGYSEDIKKGLEEIPLLQPDLVLADIRLRDGDSFELFKQLPSIDFQIIFLTAYNEYAVQALNLGALAYLLKPLQEDELIPVLEKSFKQKEHNKLQKHQLAIADSHLHPKETNNAKRIALKSLEYIEIVFIDDIMYCQSDKGYTTFFLKDGQKILVSKGLKDYDELLEPYGFARCHQSYLVNMNFVKKYFKEGYLQLISNEEIPVSSRKKEEIVKHLENI